VDAARRTWTEVAVTNTAPSSPLGVEDIQALGWLESAKMAPLAREVACKGILDRSTRWDRRA
jgi:hypothetical protein